MSITWSQALAWRIERHLLEPVGTVSIADVVRHLGAVLATDEGLAELAIRARRVRSRSGELGRPLTGGKVIKVFAFRGARHYLSPEDGGAYLALRSAGRQGELPSCQKYYELTAADWLAFRESAPPTRPGPRPEPQPSRVRPSVWDLERNNLGTIGRRCVVATGLLNVSRAPKPG